MSLPSFSPTRSLALATLISIAAHATAMLLVPNAAPGLQHVSLSKNSSHAPAALLVQLTPPRATQSPLELKMAPALDTPVQPTETSALPSVPETSSPTAPETPIETERPLQNTEIPASYRRLSELTREPALLTAVDERDWPSLPGVAPGSFELELAIGSDGSVDLIVPHCEESRCSAAEIYTEIVRRWHFQPAEILGEPIPSRLRLAFDVGIVARNETAQPRQ